MKPTVVLLCAAGLLVGCGGQKSAGPSSLPPLTAPSSPASSSATPSAASSAAPASPSAFPVVPKPADVDAFTSEGAASFVRYYVDVINQALKTNDIRLLASLSVPVCGGCMNYLESIGNTAKQGAAVFTKGVTVRDAVAPAIANGETTVLLDYDADGWVETDSTGRVIGRGVPRLGLSAELRCVRSGGHWLVMGFREAMVQQ